MEFSTGISRDTSWKKKLFQQRLLIGKLRSMLVVILGLQELDIRCVTSVRLSLGSRFEEKFLLMVASLQNVEQIRRLRP
jgi:hypothetical protein